MRNERKSAGQGVLEKQVAEEVPFPLLDIILTHDSGTMTARSEEARKASHELTIAKKEKTKEGFLGVN